MKVLYDRLNTRLEQSRQKHQAQRQQSIIPPKLESEHEPEIEALTALAQKLQYAPQVQMAPDFSQQLRRRMLRHHIELQLQRQQRKRSLFSLFRAHPAWSTILGLCLLFCVLGTGVLAMAAQASNPNNPLYALNRWEQQHFSSAPSGNPGDQATFDLQEARKRLNALSTLADANHAGAYHQALLNLDQQLNTTASAINNLPAGSQRIQLADELASLKSDAIQVLRGLLTRLLLPEHLATTDELARLGDSVPHLTSATLTLPLRPNGSATITLSGSNLQPGAQLLVDGKLIGLAGTLENGQLVFLVDWHGNQHPHSLGLLNPDGTASQTTSITVKSTDDNKNGDNSNKNNKPTATPTPRH